jgi:hypothetical protein
MALPDGLPDRKELHTFKAIYLLKDEIFVWGVNQSDDSLCPDHCIRQAAQELLEPGPNDEFRQINLKGSEMVFGGIVLTITTSFPAVLMPILVMLAQTVLLSGDVASAGYSLKFFRQAIGSQAG